MNRKIIKRAEQQVKGLILQWTDPDPLLHQADPIAKTVTHKNRIMRLYAPHIFNEYRQWITQEHCLLWAIEASIVFRAADGELRKEAITLTSKTILAEVNDAVIEEIEAAILIIKLEGGDYITTEFTIECLGA